MNAVPPDWPGSRAEQARRNGFEPELPPLPPMVVHLVEAFADLGMVQPAGMDVGPLSYTEIAAGAPWASQKERQVLRAMSRAYLDGGKIGKDPFGMPPWEG